MLTSKTKKIRRGDTIGIFTPSLPAHIDFPARFNRGIDALVQLGFQVKIGSVTSDRVSQRYRTSSPKDRARELMELFADDEVAILISNIGGSNTSSLLPYLDYELIAQSRKAVVGYSDVNSLQMALLSRAGLRSFYGPAVTPSFGEAPHPSSFMLESFMAAIGVNSRRDPVISMPSHWTAQAQDWHEKNRTDRIFRKHSHLRTLRYGSAQGRALIVNLNTVTRLLGSEYMPSMRGKILFIEDMTISSSELERNLTHLYLGSDFRYVAGMVISKPERWADSSPKEALRILREICDGMNIPIVYGFDCGHTTPIVTLAQDTLMELQADGPDHAVIRLLEEMTD